MARIFISFFDGIVDLNNPKAMSCHYESLLTEFKNAGNDILYFDHKIWGKDFGKPPKNFLNQLKKFNPDLIILFDNRCYDISKHFDCPIIIWEADSCLYFSNKEEIKKNPNRFHYIVGQTVLVPKIKELFGITSNNVHYLSSVTSTISEDLPQTTNISFIGTKFHTPDMISEFMHTKPSNKEVEIFKKMLCYVEKYPFTTEEEIFKKIKTNSTNIKDKFSVKSAIAVLSVKNRIQILSMAADLGLDLYGNESWIDGLLHEPDLALSYKNKLIYTQKQNQDIYNSSKISININHAQAQTGFSWRVCDIMASNACLVTQHKKDLEDLFPKIKIPMFSNKYEAYEICKKLLREDNMRKDIVNSCQEAIDKNFRYSHLFKKLEQIFGIIFITNNLGNIARLSLKNESIDENGKIKFRANTRVNLLLLSTMMIINQIPIINKPLMSRDQILDKIENVIKNDKK